MKEKDIRTGAWRLQVGKRVTTGDSYRDAILNFDPPLTQDEERDLDNQNTSQGDCSEW